MDDEKLNSGKVKAALIAVLVCAALYFIEDGLFRNLWCDEAITVSEFMMLADPLRIYFNYTIPNNHIVYTVLLKYWNEFCMLLLGGIADFSLRLFSLLTALTAAAALFLWVCRRAGTLAAFAAALCLVCSPAFQIYAVAVRGYMLSFLLVLAGWECALRWNESGRPRWIILYFPAALAAVGVLPSNLLIFAGIALFFLPYYSFRKLFGKKFLLTALLPVAAFLLFYLPVFPSLLKAIALKEGCSDGRTVLLNLYLPFLLAALPLALPAAVGGYYYWRKHGFNRLMLSAALLFLFPIPAVLLLHPAPYPRVFFSLWALWLTALAIPAGQFLRNRQKSSGWKLPVVALPLLILFWGGVQNGLKPYCSEKIAAGLGLDDYFFPYYLDKSFRPADLTREIRKIAGTAPPPIFISFAADPYSVRFYGCLNGINPAAWRFDGPRGKADFPADGDLAVLRGENDFAEMRERFGVENCKLLYSSGFQKFYQARYPAARPDAVKKSLSPE